MAMKTDLTSDSSFAQWCLRQTRPSDPDELMAVKKIALEKLMDSFYKGEITSFDGVESATSMAIYGIHGEHPFEMSSHWMLSAQDWVCPGCDRNKVAISRMGDKGQILGKLTIHHDHMGDAIREEFNRAFVANGTRDPQVEGKLLVERMGKAFAAHEEVLICEDCNNADTRVSSRLGSPRHFTFSVGKIKQFIRPAPHAPHIIDKDAAQKAWEDARPAYELRMRLIQEVAVAAATNRHWYEPHERHAIPIPVYGYADAKLGFATLSDWIDVGALTDALGAKKKVHVSDFAKWRSKRPKQGKAPPENYVALLHSAENTSASWSSVADDWCCPVCDRSKHDQVYLGEKEKIQFWAPGTSKDRRWQNCQICNHCHTVVVKIKNEVSARVGRRPYDSFGYFSPQELKAIIDPRPHSFHCVKPKEAEALVALAVERFTQED